MHVSEREVKVRRDPPHDLVGQLPITRGRYAGRTLAQCPVDFIIWLATSSSCPTYRRAAAEFLGLEPDQGEGPAPSPDLAAVALPGVVWRWGESMRSEFRDDAAALAVIERGLEQLQALCTEFTNRPFMSAEGRDADR